MTIGLVLPCHRADAVARAQRAIELLAAHGAAVYAEEGSLPFLSGALPLRADTGVDAFLSIGGDGTLLRAAKLAAAQNVPLLGINTGRLGFLTEVLPDDMESVLPQFLAGHYELDSRSMLQVSVDGAGTWTALNDAIVSRAGYARLIRMRLFINDQEAGTYMADGLIVSTPTGSTGYSLSAGGPVVSPHVHCMLVTPVCDHSLVNRPLIVPGRADIRIELGQDPEMQARLEADGQTCTPLANGCCIRIRRSEQKVDLVRMNSLRFFSRVHSKLAGTDE